MGFSDLRLVAPERYPAPEAQWMATNAGDVLESARIYPALKESIEDCVATFALSDRGREWSPQVLDVRTAATRARGVEGDVAFVFGNEQAGLTNDELFACQNRSIGEQSGSLAFSRRFRSWPTSFTWRPTSYPFSTIASRHGWGQRGLYAHLEAATKSGFMAPQSRLRERWRRLFSRVPGLEREEVNILRGLLKALLK